jgi:16S rRNA (cytosine967-C5)-methyltransferase
MNPSSLIGHVLELLRHIDHQKLPADRLSGEFFRARTYLGSHDRRFIAENVFGVIRHRRAAEALLERFLADHPAYSDLNRSPERYLAVLAAFSALRPLVDTRQEAAFTIPPLLWKTTYPNLDLESYRQWLEAHAGLDFLQNESPTVIRGVRYSFQDWMVDAWSENFSAEIDALLGAFNAPAPIAIRVNTLKTSRDACRERLREEGIETECTPISPAGLIARKRFNATSSPSFKEGWFEMQDEGSQIVSFIAAPQPGSTVIDSCAGAGGKTLHLANLMHNEGEIIAIDVDPKRTKELEYRAQRAGITIVRTLAREGLVPEDLAGKADLVIVDAPCSGSGTLRRNPAFKWTITESLVDHYNELQRTILRFNAQFTKPGGKLLYCTCSLFRKENEDVIDRFLAEGEGFHLERHEGLIQSVRPAVTLLPHVHNTDGFFIATLRRES